MVFKDNLSRDALALANLAVEKDTKFYFVRTFMDQTVEQEKELRAEKELQDGAVTQQVKNYIRGEIANTVLKDAEIGLYAISNKHTARFDYANLLQDILTKCPLHKKELLLSSLTSHSEQMLEQKLEMLSTRLVRIYRQCGLVGSLPVPFVVGAKMNKMILTELMFYLQTFHLRLPDIAQFENLHGLTTGTLEDFVRSQLNELHPNMHRVRLELADEGAMSPWSRVSQGVNSLVQAMNVVHAGHAVHAAVVSVATATIAGAAVTVAGISVAAAIIAAAGGAVSGIVATASARQDLEGALQACYKLATVTLERRRQIMAGQEMHCNGVNTLV